MKTRVAVLFGGKSVEHEVSVISGIQAYMNIDRETYDVMPVYISKQNEMYIGDRIGDIDAYKDIDRLLSESRRVILINEEQRYYFMPYPRRLFHSEMVEIDVVLPVVHGTNVEDGALQGYLKTVGVPFGGCDVTASAIGMDKYVQKAVLKDNGVPVLDCLRFFTKDYADIERVMDTVEAQIGYPVIVKPVNLGSSVGIGLAHDREELYSRLDDAFRYAGCVLVERGILKLREINCAVLGDENEAIASECEEPMHTGEILDYKDKYVNQGKNGKSEGMAGVSRRIPADLSPEAREFVRDMAVRAFQALGCSGVARIDFMIDEEDGSLFFNEINTIPGSLAFYLWEPVGIAYPQLLDSLITLALRRRRTQDTLTFTFDTNILNMQTLGGAKGTKTM